MTTAYSFRPEYFNNNGDQGNIEALEHFTLSKFAPGEIDNADLVLIGDASRAAMREFSNELESLTEPLQRRLDTGAPTLIVGSSYEFFCPRLNGMPKLAFGPRVSEFRTIEAFGMQVKGYRNSEVQNEDLFVKGLFVGTTLFGPVLAKNLKLAQKFATGLGLEISVSDEVKQWIALL